jgi:hypothetical protein
MNRKDNINNYNAMSAMLYAVCLALLSSCAALGFYDDGGLLNRGKSASYGQYVPKKPNYKLKDKKNHVFIERLDTINVYRYNSHSEHYPQHDFIHYIKFYPAGRCFMVSIAAKDEFGFDNRLRATDLFPEKRSGKKGYYHSKDGQQLVIEAFYEDCGQDVSLVWGSYCRSIFSVSSAGDTLFGAYGFVYAKEIIPEDWKKYPVDW